MVFRKSASRQKSLDDASPAGWMWQSQSLAMSLMDNDHQVPDKRASMSGSEDVDLSANARTVYRLVDRASNFQQAKYPISVQRILPLEDVFKLFYAKDPVLALTNLSTGKGFFVMLVFFILSCAVTALPWYAMGQNKSYQEDCSVETTGFQRAFIFSSQVIMTIGFGTKDIFFGDCIMPTIVLTVHCGVSLLVQSIIMGIIYQRLSRATSRRHTVVFSNNAVIRRIRGKLYFMLQVSELRAMQLVEAHVRLYVVRHSSMGGDNDPFASAQSSLNGTSGLPPNHLSEEDVLYTQTFAMRLSQPNDDLGSKILLSTPQVIVHEIDMHSPLRPPERWKEEAKGSSSLPHRGAARASVAFGGISSDPDGNPTSRSTVSINVNPLGRTPSMVSGSTVIDGDQQRTTHVNSGAFPANDYQFPEIIQNKGKNIPSTKPTSISNSNVDIESEVEKLKALDKEKDEIQKFLEDKNAEIVVVLEGVDPMTSHNVQSYHSYVSEEIKWDHFFVNCASVVNGWTTVDFTKFHHIKKCSSDSDGVTDAPSHN